VFPADFTRSCSLVSPGSIVSNEETAPMDRLKRIVAQGGLALMFGTSISSLGCRSMKSEIPPGKAYSTTGAPTAPTSPDIGFSSAPRPDASAAGGLYNGIQQASGTTGPGGLPGSVQQASGNPVLGGGGGEMSGRPQLGTPIGNQNNYKDAVPAIGRFGAPGTASLPPAAAMPPAVPSAQPSIPAQSANPLQGAIGVDFPNAQ
jgi:hypothetical protein